MTRDLGLDPELPRESSSPAAERSEAAAAGPADAGTDEDDARPDVDKRERRIAKRRQREAEPLDAWQRYRALSDAVDMAQDLLEFGDRKVRFGLIVIGAINVVVFGAALRTGVATTLPAAWRPWAALALAAYAVVLVKGTLEALSALRPRVGAGLNRRGLHFYNDILSREETEYDRAWRELPAGEL